MNRLHGAKQESTWSAAGVATDADAEPSGGRRPRPELPGWPGWLGLAVGVAAPVWFVAARDLPGPVIAIVRWLWWWWVAPWWLAAVADVLLVIFGVQLGWWIGFVLLALVALDLLVAGLFMVGARAPDYVWFRPRVAANLRRKKWLGLSYFLVGVGISTLALFFGSRALHLNWFAHFDVWNPFVALPITTATADSSRILRDPLHHRLRPLGRPNAHAARRVVATSGVADDRHGEVVV
ncbi:MAG: hypothetical protein ABSG64_10755 [Solirubrobacteraceae bacterium]